MNIEAEMWKRNSRRWAATAIVLTASWGVAAVAVWRWNGQGSMAMSFEEILLAADSGTNEETAVERLRAMSILGIRKIRDKETAPGRTGSIARIASSHIRSEVCR